MINVPEYYSWVGMKTRCYNPNTIYYKNYGGRGIKVCDRWLNSYENFLNDMGLKPSFEHSLDRINNDGNYNKDNIQLIACRFNLMKNTLSNDKFIDLCKKVVKNCNYRYIS